ncbi:MAG: type I glyceraldehyde-3-phosphate dehydrogenase [Bacteroidales bacterium]|nr:type I glyceraldehyde-3-phosphate dehydrogenase [Bacteroidales bacterium]MCF8404186.1 type I glyceraldehyde-3-phosphate dehydrogenase [Bacteroidales bacterium]
MSKIKIAINGFGRIGRMFMRLAHAKENFDIVAINDVMEPATMAHLLKYDSVHKKFKGIVEFNHDHIEVNGKKIKVFTEDNPENLPWKDLDVDVVIEATGKFTSREDALKHVDVAGAKKVIISAPAKGESDGVQYIVIGVNDHLINKNDKVISNSSCTTNNVAPMIKILDKFWGVEKAFITTVHSYTTDQNILDGPHKDLRRGRAAAYSIVPTTTGAAKAVTKIFPHLAKNIGGAGIRVPVPDGSLTDVTCTLLRPASIEEINNKFKEASETYLKGIMEYTEDPIVSMDVIGNSHSALFDAQLTAVLGEKNKLVKVVAWYDNEVGYSHRLVELVEKFV